MLDPILRPPLINVSRGGAASQSSLSEYSVGSDASRALTHDPNGYFHFCTDNEVYPSWEVFLGSPLPISRIEVYNREDAASCRAYPLLIEYSLDHLDWRRLAEINFAFGGAATGMPLCLDIPIPISMAHVRLRLIAHNYLHLDAVKIFTSVADIPTNSQLEQERWVLAMCNGRRHGCFAEIGAFDGVNLSNTYYLESQFGWNGVVIEPNPELFQQVQANRRSVCVNKAVYGKTGEILSFVPSGELGTIAEYAASDMHAQSRLKTIVANGLIQVETIAWNDIANMLELSHGNFNGFDYVSIDTEGSEWEILQTIDLERHKIPLLTIEHNYVSEKRDLVNAYMAKSGYNRVPVAFDDWYFNEQFLETRNEGLSPDIDRINQFFSKKYAA